MTCYLQLEDGSGFLQLEDASGNLLLETCDDVQASNWWRGKTTTHDIDRRNREYRERIEIKQSEVIDLKLNAQELLIEERELSGREDKQAKRQLRAIRKQAEEIKALIALEMAAIIEMQAIINTQEIERTNNEALAILSMAYPYLNIPNGGYNMN